MIIEHSIVIAAAPSTVWSVTQDIDAWPNWTPTVTSARRMDSGLLRVGSAAMLKQPGLPDTRWVVTDCIPEKRFTWESTLRGIKTKATHLINAHETGTENILQVEMTGFMAWLLSAVIRRNVSKALQQENEGLKHYCESKSPA